MKSNSSGDRPFFRRWDLLVIGLLLLSAVTIGTVLRFIQQADALQIEILRNNQLIQTIALPTADTEIAIADTQLILQLKNNTVLVGETDCPDKTCQKIGAISEVGQAIVCLPNRVVVKITGQNDPAFSTDGIAE